LYLWLCLNPPLPSSRSPLSLHDALPIWARPSYGAVHDFLTNPAYAGAFVFGRKRREKTVDRGGRVRVRDVEVPLEEWSVCLPEQDRKSTRLNSSHEWISYAVFCLKKKKQ